VDASASDFFRPTRDRYHHITAIDPRGRHKTGDEIVVDVVGSQCTNSDKFARQRPVPPIDEGDLLLIHDSGAHGLARGAQYNGRLRPKELFLRRDGTVELIRRKETTADYLLTQMDMDPRKFRPSPPVQASRTP
jgi:diaminopimelate decarboxylase